MLQACHHTLKFQVCPTPDNSGSGFVPVKSSARVINIINKPLVCLNYHHALETVNYIHHKTLCQRKLFTIKVIVSYQVSVGEMVQLFKCLPHKHEDLSSILRAQAKGKGRGRKIFRACWLANLAEPASSRFTERLLKNKTEQLKKVPDMDLWSPHISIHVNVHKCTYAYTNKAITVAGGGDTRL